VHMLLCKEANLWSTYVGFDPITISGVDLNGVDWSCVLVW
jgi:hypothetical protein